MPRTDRQHWQLDDIPWAQIQRARIVDDERMFLQLVAASFVESTSDLFTGNLVQFFIGDQEVSHWLQNHWEPEELQHGAALRQYVLTTWPGFDWDDAYRRFFAEYEATCVQEALQPTRARELVARCVVEMGTSTAYRTLQGMVDEPVLAQLFGRISADEVGHYRHFHRYYRRYQQHEHPRRSALLRTMAQRLNVFDDEDMYLAFKHAWLATKPDAAFDRRVYRRLRRQILHAGREHYPLRMGVRMVLKPLDLPPPARHVVEPLLAGGARALMLH